MSIEGIKSKIGNIESVEKLRSITPGNVNTKNEGSPIRFDELFDNAIKEVDNIHKEADKEIEGLILKKDGVTTHSAMLALEKADIAFQLMNQIRSKIIRAYEEVLRTQV